MLPTLRDGSIAVFYVTTSFKPGDIVLADHPTLGLIVKQLCQLDNGLVTLAGTSAESIDSVAMGALPIGALRGRLLFTV